MFQNLSEQFLRLFDKVKGHAALRQSHLDEIIDDIRNAMLEADVSIEVVKSFAEKARQKCIGQQIIKSVQPKQMIVKIVHDLIVELLHDPQNQEINLEHVPPVLVIMVGLQGAGKTTTTVKIAKYIKDNNKKNPLVASLDTRREAAKQQLEILAETANIKSLPIIENELPQNTIDRAKKAAQFNDNDVIIFDTAGRSQINQSLMNEIIEAKKNNHFNETLLVADALTGQQAAQIAQQFDQQINISGIILTRIDADSRGGAALSMRSITSKPVKFIATGEKIDDLEPFKPKRIANRILGMGDIVSLVEKAAKNLDQKKAHNIADRMKKGKTDFADLKEQIIQMKKLGGIKNIIDMIPGAHLIKKNLSAVDENEKTFSKQIAVIESMTKKEQTNPKLLNTSRKKRIANGAGVRFENVNKLIKMQKKIANANKIISKNKNLANMFKTMGTDVNSNL